MATAKLTRRIIDKLEPTDKITFIYDTELKGFGVRVMPSGIASYIVEYRPDGGGRGVTKKRMALGRTNELTPDEARQLAQDALTLVRKGDDPLSERQTKRREMKVADLIDLWEKENPPGRRSGKPMAPVTRTYTLARFRHHVIPLLGTKRVSAVSVDDVNDMIRRITKGETKKAITPGKKRGRIILKGGRGAARKVASDLSILFSYAVERKIVAVNPVFAARKPKAGKREDYLRAEHVAALGSALARLEAAGANKSGISILRLILMTGARPGEIEQLKWSEIDFHGRCLRLANTKTGYSTRPLSTAALELLKKTPEIEGSEYVFPAIRGDGYYQGSKKIWNQARSLAKLPDRVRYHARHAVATLALSSGHDIASVAAIMGHRGPRTTLSTYSHVVLDRAVEAAEQVSLQISSALNNAGNIVMLKKGA